MCVCVCVYLVDGGRVGVGVTTVDVLAEEGGDVDHEGRVTAPVSRQRALGQPTEEGVECNWVVMNVPGEEEDEADPHHVERHVPESLVDLDEHREDVDLHALGPHERRLASDDERRNGARQHQADAHAAGWCSG